jgi:transposase-like protein
MDRVQHSSSAVVGVDAIDRIGVSAIARSLGISKQAVRKWRRRGSIPDDRQGDIRQLLETLPERVSAVAQVAEVSDVVKSVPP